MFQQYQIIELINDVNPILRQGMQGVILEVWNENTVEAEFLDADGSNYEYQGNATFTLNTNDIKLCLPT